MIASEARAAASRRNSQKSTGPKTEEGKAISRANSYQHGMTGAGVVLSQADSIEVERRASAYRLDLNPRGQLQADLVRRAALLSVRLDRCAAQEAEATANRARNAEDDFDEARHAEADGLMATLASDPSGNLRRLRRMPEGVDRLVIAWTELRNDLAQIRFPDKCADEARIHRGETLDGRVAGSLGVSRFAALFHAVRGRFVFLDDEELDRVEDGQHTFWAHRLLLELVDARIAELVAHRATLDLVRIAADRLGAPKLALFDPGKAASQARRYEAAAERGFHQALRDLKELQGPQSPPKANPAYQARPSASFSPREMTADPTPPRPLGRGTERPSGDLPITIGRPPGGPE